MNRLLSSLGFIIILGALAVMVFVAFPGRNASSEAAVAAVPEVSSIVPGDAVVESMEAVAAPDQVQPRYNAIGLPLEDSSLINASDLFAYINANTSSTVSKVLGWDPTIGASGGAVGYDPLDFVPNDFLLTTGGAYLIYLEGTGGDVLTFLGDVPDQGAISFALVGDSPCPYNLISLPLDQGGITVASEFVAAVGDVSKVLEWDPTIGASGGAVGYDPSDFVPNDISMQIGYAYLVCMTASKTWPAP